MAGVIDLLELQILTDYPVDIVSPTIYPATYHVSAGELTEAKRIPCCIPCYPIDPKFINKKRKYASQSARIAAKKLQAITCVPDYDSE